MCVAMGVSRSHISPRQHSETSGEACGHQTGNTPAAETNESAEGYSAASYGVHRNISPPKHA